MGPSKRSGASHAGVVDTSSQGSNLLALHRSKFWDWTPSTVVAISGCPGAPLAAVGYETGDLELWDLSNMTCINVSSDGHGMQSVPIYNVYNNVSAGCRN